MYKTAIKAVLRHCITRLNAGDPTLLLRLASPDCELAFPGDNSWSTQFRPVEKGRQRHVTHRGLAECRAEHVHGEVEEAAGAGGIALGPEQRHRAITRERLRPGRDDQGEERDAVPLRRWTAQRTVSGAQGRAAKQLCRDHGERSAR